MTTRKPAWKLISPFALICVEIAVILALGIVYPAIASWAVVKGLLLAALFLFLLSMALRAIHTQDTATSQMWRTHNLLRGKDATDR